MNEFISDEIKEVVKRIASDYPDVTFCGSFGLVLNGLLHRNVGDIDILVSEIYYNKGGFYDEERVAGTSDSNKFMVGNDQVLSFKIKLNDVKVDVLYNENNLPSFKKVKFEDMYIKVEIPESAINAKKLYVVIDLSHDSILKHIKDLIYLEVEKNEIINLIDKSHLND